MITKDTRMLSHQQCKGMIVLEVGAIMTVRSHSLVGNSMWVIKFVWKIPLVLSTHFPVPYMYTM